MLCKNEALLPLFTTLLPPSCKHLFLCSKKISVQYFFYCCASKFLCISHRQSNFSILKVWGVNWSVGSEIANIRNSFWWEDSKWLCFQAQPFTPQVPSLLRNILKYGSREFGPCGDNSYQLVSCNIIYFLSMSLPSVVHLKILLPKGCSMTVVVVHAVKQTFGPLKIRSWINFFL